MTVIFLNLLSPIYKIFIKKGLYCFLSEAINVELKIYADVLFAICSLMVFTAYGAAALICGIGVRIKRLVFGSFAVSLISTLLVLYLRHFVNPVSIFVLVMLGTYLCLGVTAVGKNIICSLTCLICAVFIGGARTAAGNIGINDNTILGIVFTTALLYIGFFAVIKKVRAVTVNKQKFCRLTVCKGDKKAELTALVDTGNELKGSDLESVIIAERQAVETLFENAQTDLRLLPFKSVGSSGVLFGVLCDHVLIDGVKKENVIVAAVDVSLGTGAYNALIDPEVI